MRASHVGMSYPEGSSALLYRGGNVTSRTASYAEQSWREEQLSPTTNVTALRRAVFGITRQVDVEGPSLRHKAEPGGDLCVSADEVLVLT
jgi:hypothetical protein